MDLSIILSIVAIFISAASVIVPMLLNMYTQKVTFRREFIQKRKHEVVENYLKSMGKIAFSNVSTDRVESTEWLSEIYMYAPQELWADIDKMNSFVVRASSVTISMDEKDYCINQIGDNYIEFCKKFSFISREKKHKKCRKAKKLQAKN